MTNRTERFAKATRQTALNIAVPALLKQGKRSMHPDGIVCAYRGKDGAKCAVGWLMDDEDYDPAFDNGNRGWWDVLTTIGVPDSEITDRGFYNDLQACHDQAKGDFIPELMANIKNLCAEYNLTCP